MTPSHSPTRSFATLPREIRDMIFAQVASAAGLRIQIRQTFELYIDDAKGYAECIIMLHEWATRSHIAEEACEALWARDPFIRKWLSLSDLVIDPKASFRLRYWTGAKTFIYLGAPIDPGRHIRDIIYDVDLPLDSQYVSYLEDDQNLSELGRELSGLATFPCLRQVRIHFSILEGESDAYHSGLKLVESLLNPCKQLRCRLGINFKFLLIRKRRYESRDDFIERLDISWMWDSICHVPRECVERELNDAEEHIKTLIDDGADLNGGKPLLEELRAAASKLPQRKKEIARMEHWSVGTGVSKKEWLWLRGHREEKDQ